MKFCLLALLVVTVLANTVMTCVVAVKLRDDRVALKSLENDIKDVKQALETEIKLRQHLFPKLKKSVNLLMKYNPNLDYMTAITYAGKIYECSDDAVRFDILNALIVVESGADYRAVSKKGALGLTQVMPSIWNYDHAALINPYRNIEIGAAILKHYVKRFGLMGGLSAYNSGKRNASLRYARKVLKIAQRHF